MQFDRQLFHLGFKSPNAKLGLWDEDFDILDFPPIMQDGRVIRDNDCAFLVSCELNTWYMAGLRVELTSEDPDPVSLLAVEYEIMILAERDPKYYLFNYILVMYIIVVLNVLNFIVSVSLMGERSAASLTILLATVAFKFVLGSSLPKIGYSTVADVYVRVSFLTLFVGCFENFFVAPKLYCIQEYFQDGASAGVTGSITTCELDQVVRATQIDIVFQCAYFAWWTLFNALAAFLCLFPNLVRVSWKEVSENQIGDTEATTERTNEVWNADEDPMLLISQ